MEKKISFFIKSSLFVFLICFILVNPSAAQENSLLIQGKEAQPFFDQSGNLNIIYVSSDGDIRLLIQGRKETKIRGLRTSSKEKNIYSLGTQKDRFGNRWLLWEERGNEQSDIYLARLESNTALDQICLTDDENGFNFSPALDFSPSNDLWIAWVNYYGGENRIILKNVSSDQKWEINSYSGLDPQLLIDDMGRIWLFWAGQFRNHDEILYTVYDRGAWKETSTLNQSPDAPHINPSVVSDDHGFIHVVWSAYDGEDYELYYSYWNGYNWSAEGRITDDSHTADGFACMNLFYGEVPAVAWVKSFRGKQEVWLNYKRGDRWSQGIKVSDSDEISSPLKIISSQEKTWILWQSRNLIKAVPVNNYRLQEYFVSQKKNSEPIYETLGLDKNKFIGFGDSITYGIINLQPAPDKGYVPRLESLIQSNINSNAVVLNRGHGGEKTSEGLSLISSVINSDQAKTIFLMEGTNDIKDTSVSIDSTAYNLEQMANKCVNFNMKTFFSTIIPRMGMAGIIEDRIYALNGKISAIASSPSIYFVDIFNAFLNYPGGWINLFSDTTHPNETGYQIMAKTWFNAYAQTLPPTISLSNSSLYFEEEITDTEIPSKNFKVKNSGGRELVYDISTNKDWLSVSPSSGKSTGEWDTIEVTVDMADLSYGLHEGEITISSDNATNSPRTVDVDLYIIPPTISLSNSSLYFEAVITDTEIPSKNFKVKNSGGGELVYDISTNKDWLSVSPSSGKSIGEWDTIEVTVDMADLSYGLHEGEITISSDKATNNPRTVDVDLYIKLPPLYPPANFQGKKEENRSLALVQYINGLTWEANDQNEDIIEKYRIYLVEDEEASLLIEVSASTFEYWHRNVEKDKVYTYGITTVDIYGRESGFVYLDVQ